MSECEQRILNIPVEVIDPGINVRERISKESVADLATTVKKRGVQEPVTVRRVGERYILLRGFRRFEAARLAGKTTIRAIIEPNEQSKADVLVSQLTENLHREDLTEMELAAAIERLIAETGWTAAQVAAELGLKAPHVCNLRSLLTLPEEVKQAVKSKGLSASAAFEIARADGTQIQIQLAAEAIQSGLTRDAVVAKVRDSKRKRGNANANATGRVTAPLGDGQSVSVTAAELTLERFIALLEELLSKARRARPKGLELSTFIKMLRDQSRSVATPETKKC